MAIMELRILNWVYWDGNQESPNKKLPNKRIPNKRIHSKKKKKTILDCTGSRAAISSNLLPFCLSSIFRDFGKIPQKSQIADSSCQKNPLGKKVNEKKKKKNSEKGLSSTMHVLFPARKLIQRKKKKKMVHVSYPCMENTNFPIFPRTLCVLFL